MWASGFAPDPRVDDTGATPLRPPRTHAPSTVSGGPIHAAEVVPGEAAGSGSGEESRVLATGATHRDTRADNDSYDIKTPRAVVEEIGSASYGRWAERSLRICDRCHALAVHSGGPVCDPPALTASGSEPWLGSALAARVCAKYYEPSVHKRQVLNELRV